MAEAAATTDRLVALLPEAPVTFTSALLNSDLLPLVLSHLDLQSLARCSHCASGFCEPVEQRLRYYWVATGVIDFDNRSRDCKRNPGGLLTFLAALPDGDILVSDSVLTKDPRSSRVLRLCSAGVSVFHSAPTGSLPIQPSGLALAGETRTVYIASSRLDHILGVPLRPEALRPTNSGPISLRLSEDNERYLMGCAWSSKLNLLFVVESDGGRVVALDCRAGTERFALASAAPEMQDPFDVAISASGFVYVSDSGNKRIAVFGEMSRQFVGCVALPLGSFDDPSGLAFTPDGRLIVADASYGLRILPLAPDGLTVLDGPVLLLMPGMATVSKARELLESERSIVRGIRDEPSGSTCRGVP